MPRQPRVRSRWGIGAIRLARAAAFVILVIGIAETLTLVLPKGSALYVYLSAFGLAIVALAAITRAMRPRQARPMIEAAARPLLLPAPADPRVEEELIAAKAVIGDLYARIDEEVQQRKVAEESLAAMTVAERDTTIDELRQSLSRAVATVTEITTARMTAEDAQHRAVAAAADLNAKLQAERVAAEQARAAAERLQKMYDELRQSMGEQLEAATAEIDAGRRRGVELQRESASLRDELAARDQQWDAKLNDIVTHLASDHEADIGQATLEKEEARAETRSLSKKLTALQQRLEHDHQAFRAARDKWIAMQKEREARLQQAIADLTRQLAEARAAAATRIAALRGVPRRRVLIVHRDAALRDLSRRALEPLGYEVLTAADGLEGLRVATAQKPDAVIAETLMPKMDGRAMMAFLQSRADTAGIRVALMAESTPDAVALQSTVASVLGVSG